MPSIYKCIYKCIYKFNCLCCVVAVIVVIETKAKDFIDYLNLLQKEVNRLDIYPKEEDKNGFPNLSLTSRGVLSVHARVCGDHFVKGKSDNSLIEANNNIIVKMLYELSTFYDIYK